MDAWRREHLVKSSRGLQRRCWPPTCRRRHYRIPEQGKTRGTHRPAQSHLARMVAARGPVMAAQSRSRSSALGQKWMTAAAATPPAGRVDVPASHRIDCRMGPEGGQFCQLVGSPRGSSWPRFLARRSSLKEAEFVWLAVLGETCDAFHLGMYYTNNVIHNVVRVKIK